MNPLDPSSTAQYIDVVLVRVPKFTAKAYYSGTYNADNEEAQTPICFSSTGIILIRVVLSLRVPAARPALRTLGAPQ